MQVQVAMVPSAAVNRSLHGLQLMSQLMFQVSEPVHPESTGARMARRARWSLLPASNSSTSRFCPFSSSSSSAHWGTDASETRGSAAG